MINFYNLFFFFFLYTLTNNKFYIPQRQHSSNIQQQQSAAQLKNRQRIIKFLRGREGGGERERGHTILCRMTNTAPGNHPHSCSGGCVHRWAVEAGCSLHWNSPGTQAQVGMAVAVEVGVRHKETPVVALLMEKGLQTLKMHANILAENQRKTYQKNWTKRRVNDLEENDEYAGNSSSAWPIEGRLLNRNY